RRQEKECGSQKHGSANPCLTSRHRSSLPHVTKEQRPCRSQMFSAFGDLPHEPPLELGCFLIAGAGREATSQLAARTIRLFALTLHLSAQAIIATSSFLTTSPISP